MNVLLLEKGVERSIVLFPVFGGVSEETVARKSFRGASQEALTCVAKGHALSIDRGGCRKRVENRSSTTLGGVNLLALRYKGAAHFGRAVSFS